MKLSERQREGLDLLAQGPVDEFQAAWMLGPARQRTMACLVERGLARWHYTSEVWRITAKGRAMLKQLDRSDCVSTG